MDTFGKFYAYYLCTIIDNVTLHKIQILAYHFKENLIEVLTQKTKSKFLQNAQTQTKKLSGN